jgi:hypothetical protein
MAWLSTAVPGTPALAAGFVPIQQDQWDQTKVREVLDTFAFGGFATDAQIETWARMTPQNAIEEMLTFQPVNRKLSPVQDKTADHAGGLRNIQDFLSSNDPANATCPSERDRLALTETNGRGEVILSYEGLQYAWIAAANKRGLNPFRHKVGLWLTNYHMALRVRPTLMREFYDSVLDALADHAPFHEVLATGATSAAVARAYGHKSNVYNNKTGRFRGNDNFAREFFQLYARINGDTEDTEYHEETTIENMARTLTGMKLDQEPYIYGLTRKDQWNVAPIDFSDHVDGTGRVIGNVSEHHQGALEILHERISGHTAEEKIFNLAEVAIHHRESLKNLPVAIIGHFGDDNLTEDKKAAIRAEWRKVVGRPDDLLRFLRAYAISTLFHNGSRIKYRTTIDRNMTLYNLNTVDNTESYGNSYSPRLRMRSEGGLLFEPVHEVFGGQTSLEAANSSNLFREAYNNAVYFYDDIAKTEEECRNNSGKLVRVWKKDWARIVPAKNGVYTVGGVSRWLWRRFIASHGDLENFGLLERAYIAGFLARGLDFGYVVNPDNPGKGYSSDDLSSGAVAAKLKALETETIALNSTNPQTRREANRRVGMAINFITMTPFMFASKG